MQSAPARRLPRTRLKGAFAFPDVGSVKREPVRSIPEAAAVDEHGVTPDAGADRRAADVVREVLRGALCRKRALRQRRGRL